MMTDAAQATPQEPATDDVVSPAVDVVHDVDGAVARQQARLAAVPPPAEAAPAPATPAPAPAQAVEIELEVPDEARLLEEAKQRRAEQAQRAPYDALSNKLEALEKQLAGLPTGPAIPLSALASSDPAAVIAALRGAGLDPAALTKTLARGVMAPTPVDQIGALIDAKLAPLLERITPKAQPQQEQAPPINVDEVKATYAAYLDASGDRWPYLASLSRQLGPEMAADTVYAYARRMHLQGVDTSRLTDEQLSSMFEKKYGPQGQPSGAPPASGGPNQPPGAPSASGGTTKTAAPPRTVTAGLAASAAPAKPPETDAEIYSAAVARQRARLQMKQA